MNLLIIQARMGSTRLPGKVLKTIKGLPMLEIQLMRLAKAKLVDQIVVATTTNPEDDKIADLCHDLNIPFSRGSDWDVLARYYSAAKEFNPDNVIRVTSDCVLHHGEVVDFVVSEFLKSGKDYFSNSNHEPEFLEDGFDVEVFSFKALETAFNEAKLHSEREHVTPFIKNSGKFKCGWKKFNPAFNYKLSVDTPDDFALASLIFNHFSSLTEFGLNDVVELLQQNPGLLQVNSSSVINSGYKKSIENDKEIN